MSGQSQGQKLINEYEDHLSADLQSILASHSPLLKKFFLSGWIKSFYGLHGRGRSTDQFKDKFDRLSRVLVVQMMEQVLQGYSKRYRSPLAMAVGMRQYQLSHSEEVLNTSMRLGNCATSRKGVLNKFRAIVKKKNTVEGRRAFEVPFGNGAELSIDIMGNTDNFYDYDVRGGHQELSPKSVVTPHICNQTTAKTTDLLWLWKHGTNAQKSAIPLALRLVLQRSTLQSPAADAPPTFLQQLPLPRDALAARRMSISDSVFFEISIADCPELRSITEAIMGEQVSTVLSSPGDLTSMLAEFEVCYFDEVVFDLKTILHSIRLTFLLLQIPEGKMCVNPNCVHFHDMEVYSKRKRKCLLPLGCHSDLQSISHRAITVLITLVSKQNTSRLKMSHAQQPGLSNSSKSVTGRASMKIPAGKFWKIQQQLGKF